jgi:hypothetical protein
MRPSSPQLSCTHLVTLKQVMASYLLAGQLSSSQLPARKLTRVRVLICRCADTMRA